MLRLVVFILVALATSAFSQALVWEKDRIFLDIPPGSAKVSGEIRFTNSSDAPINIRQVIPSCGCFASKPTQTQIGPHEVGAIPFTYSPKKRWGPAAYRIYVKTDEKKSKPYFVTIQVTEHRLGENTVEP